ncbi:type IV secretory system conjugative DNA transfer family protein [Spiroplasma endosymbiont of Labia minor]|uniref:type IV secretory system conjugative DNA transfer family protein n=1 Tax=Spiroplasma endosymbiont of Labia minor TaxID=3066305 RepID=UPI0030CA6E75
MKLFKKPFWTKERKIWLKIFLWISVIVIPICSFILYFLLAFIFDWKILVNNFKLVFKNDIRYLFISIAIIIISWILFCGYWIIFKTKKHDQYIKKTDRDDYGGAKWLKNDLNTDEQEPIDKYLKHFIVKPVKPFWLTATEGTKDKKLVMHGADVRDAVHNLVLGATGSGKGQKLVMPNAVGNARIKEVYDDKGNLTNCKPAMLFTDPKGELKANLAGELVRNGYEVLTLNLRDTDESSYWNPLKNTYDYWIKGLDWEKDNIDSEKFIAYDLLEKYVIEHKMLCNIHKETHCFECLNGFKEFRQEELQVLINKLDNINDDMEIENDERDKKTAEIQEQINKFNDWIILYFSKIENIWFVSTEQKDITIFNKIEKYKNEAYEEITDITDTILDCGEDTKNKNFYETAKGLMSGMIKVMLDIIEVNRDILPLEKFNLPTITKLMANEKMLKIWWKNYAKNGRELNDAWTSASKVIDQSEKQAPMYFSIISTALQIFESRPLRKVLCTPKKRANILDLFNFVTKEKPKAIFIILPDEKKDKHPLAALFVAQLYKANAFIASQNVKTKGRDELDRDMLWFLDEFGNMPAIPNFDTYLTVSHSRRMFFMLFLQDLSQLNLKYDKAQTAIKSNCLLWTYLKSNSREDLKTVSDLIGDETILTASHNTNAKMNENKAWTLTSKKLINETNLKLLPLSYSVILYYVSNPSICKMEYAYNFEKFLNLKANFREENRLQRFDYEQDHYFNLFSIDFDKLIENKANENDNLESSNDVELETLDDNDFDILEFDDIDSEEKQLETEIDIAKKELELRNKIIEISKSESRMTTLEKERYRDLVHQLVEITTKKTKLTFLTKYKKEK